MFKKVLVTGGAGFIGSHTVDLLLEQGCHVVVLDSLEPQVHGNSGKPPAYLSTQAEFIRGDVRDRDLLLRALKGCDAVIHDAAQVGVAQSQYQIFRYTAENVVGTATLLDVLTTEKTGVERLLVASSMSIYGEGQYRRSSDGALVTANLRNPSDMEAGRFGVFDPETGEELLPIPTPEEKPLHCTSIYALNKKDQEEYALLAGEVHGLSTVACRYFNVYGPRQSLSNPYTGVAAIFSSRIKNGNRPLIYEDGEQSRDFIQVRDLAAAKVFLLNNPKAGGRAYNLCTGRPTTVRRIAEYLAELLGRPDLQPEITGGFRAGDIRHCIGDPSRLAALGWKASITLEDGLAELVEWSSGQDAVDAVDKAHQELVDRGLIKK
ncbi:MAG: SDR family NAD(P)-dependent oxidoreductase [Candidatus Sumerlaeia bacterium]|nr:SDR family NAD(P)-dependent oxidoreductase [Candidatus Sumerlaeia bacterium]